MALLLAVAVLVLVLSRPEDPGTASPTQGASGEMPPWQLHDPLHDHGLGSAVDEEPSAAPAVAALRSGPVASMAGDALVVRVGPECVAASDFAVRLRRRDGSWSDVAHGASSVWRWDRLAPGDYEVDVSGPALLAGTVHVALGPGTSDVAVDARVERVVDSELGSATQVTLTAEPRNRISGVLVDEETGEPPAAAVIVLQSRALIGDVPGAEIPTRFPPIAKEWPAERGRRFCLGGWAISRSVMQVRVIATAPGYAPASTSWWDVAAAPAFTRDDVELVLRRPARITGRVTDSRGEALPSAIVRWIEEGSTPVPGFVLHGRLGRDVDPRARGMLLDDEAEHGDALAALPGGEVAIEPSTQTGTDGRFELHVLAPARGVLQALHPGLGSAESRPLELLPGAVEPLDLSFGTASGLVGKVTRAGQPIPGARFELRPTRAPPLAVSRWEFTAGLDGVFELEPLPAGDFELVTFVPHRAGDLEVVAERRSVSLEPGRLTELAIDLADRPGIPVFASVHQPGALPLIGGLLDAETGARVGQASPVVAGDLELRAPLAAPLIVSAVGEGVGSDGLELVVLVAPVDLSGGRSPPTVLLDATRSTLSILTPEAAPPFWRLVPRIDEPDLRRGLAMLLARLPTSPERLLIRGLPPGRYRLERGDVSDGSGVDLTLGSSALEIEGPGLSIR